MEGIRALQSESPRFFAERTYSGALQEWAEWFE